MDSRIQKNSVVQVNDKGHEGWVGCLLQVDEVKTWGIIGHVQIPHGGIVPIRISRDSIDFIGEALMESPL